MVQQEPVERCKRLHLANKCLSFLRNLVLVVLFQSIALAQFGQRRSAAFIQIEWRTTVQPAPADVKGRQRYRQHCEVEPPGDGHVHHQQERECHDGDKEPEEHKRLKVVADPHAHVSTNASRHRTFRCWQRVLRRGIGQMTAVRLFAYFTSWQAVMGRRRCRMARRAVSPENIPRRKSLSRYQGPDANGKGALKTTD